jgi:hypothetical protein
MTIHPDLKPQQSPIRDTMPPLESELLGVYVPPSGLFQDDLGREFFVTAVEFWDGMTVVSLCWKRRPVAGQGGPPLTVTDENGLVLGVKRIWAAGSRSVQHFEPIPKSARALTVLLARGSGTQELFSCRTPPPKTAPVQ